MNKLVIVNTETGARVGIPFKAGSMARWSDGIDVHAPRVGLIHGTEKIVQVIEGNPTGSGSLVTVSGEAWDGVDAWVISRVRSDPPPTSVAVIAASMKAQVDAERDRRRYPGDVDTGLGWAVDLRNAKDEDNIAGKVMRALSIKADASAETIEFMGADNLAHDLTADEMISVGRACDDVISNNYAGSWAIKAQIDAAVAAVEDAEAGGDPETIGVARAALEAIDPVNGW